MAAQMMKAAYVTALGAAEEIRVGLVPVPAPGATEVLVQVEAVAVNPVDTYVRSGRYPTPAPMPFVVGRELTSALPGDHERCRAVGAEVALDYRDPALAQQLAEHAPEGVDVIWNTSGHHDFALVTQVAAARCRVLITAATAEQPAIPLPRLYTRDVSLRGFVISRATVAELAAAARLINQMLRSGRLTANIAGCLPLADAAAAHRRIENGEVRGRLLLTI
jgi:NADPH:quinone reductase-like Zn-dependent oxidoreductase